jgi:hypothetical protein
MSGPDRVCRNTLRLALGEDPGIKVPRHSKGRRRPVPPCALPALHHSDDRVTVYHGRTSPVVVCGFHAQWEWLPEALNTLNEAGLLSPQKEVAR